ncbi:MAG: hypothetical protein V8S12_05390 [Lachnospiraceae bacterium]
METIIKKFIPDYYNAIELGLTLCKLNEINLSDIAGLLVELLGPDYHYSEVYGGLFNVANDAVTIGGVILVKCTIAGCVRMKSVRLDTLKQLTKKGIQIMRQAMKLRDPTILYTMRMTQGEDYTARESWYDVQDNQDRLIVWDMKMV